MSLRHCLAPLINGVILLPLMLACNNQSNNNGTASVRPQLPPEPSPREYICYRSDETLVIDGKLTERAWQAAPWTDYFVDIEGDVKPSPKYKTRAKMLWDDVNVYIAAELEEPHVWARLKNRDTVIFYDNDFEVFIDPDGDTHAYYELEVNAIGTAWDLMLLKPYRDGGPPVNGWDIAGLKVGTHIDGTLNNPADTDKGWYVEMSLPLAALRECNSGGRMPVSGDHWRLGFSRVEWRTIIENGNYRKEINPQTGKPYPEDNWVWSPQGRINMHMPEMWGIIQFSGITAGSGSEQFIADAALKEKRALMVVYYSESAYYERTGRYSSSLAQLGLTAQDFPVGIPTPVIEMTSQTYHCYIPSSTDGQVWTINNESKLSYRPLPVKK